VRGGDDLTQRTRAAYDAVASEYADAFVDELEHKPLDRALLDVLIEQAPGGGPIADIGCGPGHVAAWLSTRGADALGVDLSPRMVAEARVRHPSVEYRVGDMRNLPAADGEWGGAVAFYSIIHVPPAELPAVFGEIGRCLRPGGLLLVAFHCGSEIRHLDEWFGHEVSLDGRELEVAEVEAALVTSGFAVEMRMDRVNYPEEGATRRAYVLARRPDA
jgi:SAM-dependent methyltransferase